MFLQISKDHFIPVRQIEEVSRDHRLKVTVLARVHYSVSEDWEARVIEQLKALGQIPTFEATIPIIDDGVVEECDVSFKLTPKKTH
jgi:hypothetical protein